MRPWQSPARPHIATVTVSSDQHRPSRRTCNFLAFLLVNLFAISAFASQWHLVLSPHKLDLHEHRRHHRRLPWHVHLAQSKRNRTTRNSTESFSGLSGGYRYNICALTRVRNAAEEIPPWIEYHRIAGVDHFFVADDCSNDNGSTFSVLSSYHATRFVTFIPYAFGFNTTCLNHVPSEKKLFKHLFRRAKKHCEWIGVWDVDEYLTSTNIEYLGNFLGFLQKNPAPLVRFPWFIVGSEGMERRPHEGSLDIELFRHGRMDNHVKTIGRSAVLDDWEFSHFPTIKYKFVDLRRRYQFARLWKDELYNSTNENGKRCEMPKSPFFLKHFQYKSYEDFIHDRGSRKVTSGNSPNPWMNDPRSKWLGGNFSDCMIAQEFTEVMARLVHEALNKRAIFGFALQ